MNKICICGHFANGTKSYDGQTIKTRNVYNQLIKKYGEENVSTIDTNNWKKHPFKILKKCINSSKTFDNIIILPAHKGFKVFVPLFNALKNKKNFKLHYIVIGGWLYSLVKSNRLMQKELSKVDYIYLENNKTIKQLKTLGINNLYQMNNFKDLKVSSYRFQQKENELNCCIFSRIEEKKGINNAIDIIKKINKDLNFNVNLDIYGKISQEYQVTFNDKLKDSKNVFYKGVIESDKSVETIEKYDLLLFPTLYYTEGIPGTIIDSFFAGVPVLASKWENFEEILEEGITGYSYTFQDDNSFLIKFEEIIKNRKELLKMRKNCKEKSKEYNPKNSMEKLFKNIGE